MRTVRPPSLLLVPVVAAVAAALAVGCSKEREARTLRPVADARTEPVAASASKSTAITAPEAAVVATQAGAPVAPPATPQAPKADATPIYRIEPPSFELGVVETNSSHDLEFAVINQGDRPFNIVYTTTECKCMTLDVDRGMLKPGDSTKIKLRVQATASNERKTAAILHLSDPAKSKVRVEVHYAIVPEILVEPKGVGFGRVESGKAVESTLRVTMHLPASIKEIPQLEPFIAHELPIKLWFDEPVITATAGGMRDWVATLHLQLDASQPIEQFLTHLVFKPKDKLAHRELLVRVTGEVVPAWYFERGVVAFGSVDVGQEVEKEMRFFFPGPEAPTLQSVDTDVAGLQVAAELDAEQRCYVIKLKFAAAESGKVEGKVNLLTSLSSAPSELRITARVK